LKKPEDWVYLVGTPFAISAFIAISVSIYPTSDIVRSKKKFVYWASLGFMGAGFAYLLGIFFTIGTS